MVTLIILLTVIFSYRGFIDERFFLKYSFSVEKVLVNKEYICLLSSGFLHVNWWHLIFNMIALFAFSNTLIAYIGILKFMIIFLSSMIGGNLIALLIHRNHGSYSAVGSSGGVNGIIFSSIALFPGMGIGFFFIPISIPSWIYGIIFLGVSIYGIRSRRDNVGHESHLGGAIIGMLITLLFYPAALIENYIPILIILIPSFIFLYFIIYSPQTLMVSNLFYRTNYKFTVDQRYNMKKVQEQLDIDAILEKIHRKGINSLSKSERQRLEEYSKSK